MRLVKYILPHVSLLKYISIFTRLPSSEYHVSDGIKTSFSDCFLEVVHEFVRVVAVISASCACDWSKSIKLNIRCYFSWSYVEEILCLMACSGSRWVNLLHLARTKNSPCVYSVNFWSCDEKKLYIPIVHRKRPTQRYLYVRITKLWHETHDKIAESRK